MMNEEQETTTETYEEPAQQKQTTASSWLQKLKSYWTECVRVLRVTKKPTGDEFKTIVKISGLGILLIGLIGFIIQMLKLTLL